MYYLSVRAQSAVMCICFPSKASDKKKKVEWAVTNARFGEIICEQEFHTNKEGIVF